MARKKCLTEEELQHALQEVLSDIESEDSMDIDSDNDSLSSFENATSSDESSAAIVYPADWTSTGRARAPFEFTAEAGVTFFSLIQK